MTESKTAAAGPRSSTSAPDLLAAEISRRISSIEEALAAGRPPSEEDVRALEQLAKIKALVPNRWASRRKRIELLLLLFATSILLGMTSIRLPTTAVHLDVRTTGIQLTTKKGSSDFTVPGEPGEIVRLKEVYVTHADSTDPPYLNKDGAFELEELKGTETTGKQVETASAVRLQELTIPAGGSRLIAALAYRRGARGLLLATSGGAAATARLRQVVRAVSATSRKPKVVLWPVTASGNALSLELFPIEDSQKSLTVIRNCEASELTFEAEKHTSILGGAIFVESLPEASVTAQSGDRLQISSDHPILIREITFSKEGELHVILTADQVTAIRLGGKYPRNLMPTLFDWVYSRWPTQLYAALSAAVALWFVARTWWESST